MLKKTEEILKRYRFLSDALADAEVIADIPLWRKYSKEHADIRETAEKYEEYLAAEKEMKDAFELAETETDSDPMEKRDTLLKLYDAGLLSDENGKVTMENKARILEAFGFGSYENAKDISALHLGKAGEENIAMKVEDVEVDGYDNHLLHIGEHTRFLLSAEFKKTYKKDDQGKELKARYAKHIEEHKAKLKKGE